MTRTLAVEWGQHGLRVNAVAPGYVDTEMIRSGFREITLSEAELLRRTPLGRLAQADDIAFAVAFLLGHDPRFVHGVTLKVDGGITIVQLTSGRSPAPQGRPLSSGRSCGGAMAFKLSESAQQAA